MKSKNFLLGLITNILLLSMSGIFYAQIKSPEEHFGYQPGSDRNLFSYEELINYLKILDDASPRLKLTEIGKSPMGRTMYIVFISDKENINNLEELKEINKKLALNPDLTQQEKENMVKDGKIFVLATLSMHSVEVGPSQASSLIAYDLITTNDPQKLEILKNVVYMMVPCHNPDGMDMIVEHYLKYKGTRYEGSSMPGVYHKYVGHDNNRDFVILSQEDTKAIARIYNQEWFPQVMVEKHQMGSTGTRYFVPPTHDPIAENVDAGIWNWTGIFGANMMKDMTRQGLAGVSQHYLFDDYWPGSTETCIWKNVVGMLTEGASAKVATPVFIEPNELNVDGKGLSEYKKGVNMPLPWEGGWWRLSDLIQYEITSTLSILKTASDHRQELLRFRNELCVKEVAKGRNEPPYYYILPLKQHDNSEFVNLVNLMKEHGVNVYRLTKDIYINNVLYSEGSVVFPLSQPFRAFIKEVLEAQEYPVRHYTPDGEIIRPYDIASWSLPLHFGVKADEINIRSTELEQSIEEIRSDFTLYNPPSGDFSAVIFPVEYNESFRIAFQAITSGINVERLDNDFTIDERIIRKGSFMIRMPVKNQNKLNILLSGLSTSPIFVTNTGQISSHILSIPRIALVESNFHDMDAGWTRYVFDQYGISYTVVKPGEFRKINFAQNYDEVIFPDVSKSILMEGKYGTEGDYQISDYPPEYTKGIGKEGMKNLMSFVDRGGVVIAWGRSVSLFQGPLVITSEKDTDEFALPFEDISNELAKKGLYCPGSLIKMKLTNDHPLTLGMEEEIGIFFRGRPVISTSVPYFDMDRRVLGTIPEKNILMSGYIEKEEVLENKTVMTWMRKGKGQFVFFAFNPQFRASTHVSYKLLFNSILMKSEKQ